MKTNHRNISVAYIGKFSLLARSDFHNPRLAYFEKNEHTYGNYRKVEREVTVERLLQLEDMNRHKTSAMYESGFNEDLSWNDSVYQATH